MGFGLRLVNARVMSMDLSRLVYAATNVLRGAIVMFSQQARSRISYYKFNTRRLSAQRRAGAHGDALQRAAAEINRCAFRDSCRANP